MESLGNAFKSMYHTLSRTCNIVDCCSGVRSCNQFVFPCIRCCSYGNRRVFYNYDGTETVQPLVDYFRPTNKLSRTNLVKGMSLPKERLRIGLTAVEQIAEVVRYAYDNDLRLRAVGSGASWSKLTNVRDILIDMRDLTRIVRAKPQNDEGTIYHIEVQGGKILHDLVREIDSKYGMSLPCMGNYAGQTIAGIISTSTHGTGQDYPTMSNFVIEVHMVVARGIQIKVRLPKNGEAEEDFESVRRRVEAAKFGDPPLEIQSTEVFRAVAVGFGSLGVIYSVTLECIPVFNIAETRHYIDIEWPEKTEEFRIPEELRVLSEGHGKFFSFFVNPFPRDGDKSENGHRTLKAVYLSGEKTLETGTCQCNMCMDMQCFTCTGCRGQSACQIVQTDCSASCFQMITRFLPCSLAYFADCGLEQFARGKIYIQRWYNVLTFTNGNIHVKTAEYCVPLSNLDGALHDILKIMQQYGEMFGSYTLLPVYVRMVKADDLYLSPANRKKMDGSTSDRFCFIEVPFLPGAYGIDEFHKKIEDHLYTHYKARPHWSKNNFLNHKRVQQLYPELEKWKQVYLLFNRDGTFDNEFTRKCGFEDFHATDDEIVNEHVVRGGHGNPCVCQRLGSRVNTRDANVDNDSRDGGRDSSSDLSSEAGSRTVEVVVEGDRTDLWVRRDSGRHVSPCSCDDSTLGIPMGKSGAIVHQPSRSSLTPFFAERTPLASDTKEVVESAARHGCGAATQRGSDTYPHPLPTVKSTMV
ncbi:L-gulono-1,4-lactone dehydrogenase-like [Lytechinus variegatus]|uniref:L-gulono-1,4-lactone dehydrogenase-like n=1 Tax=Lytechinus variegatus TaxID=7654 RepID=UPI001BB26280|nr:L-gulono-1,4-lactone dehydrogenase-like [Lytechinus variegatus]